jgi:hypothetical protein
MTLLTTPIKQTETVDVAKKKRNRTVVAPVNKQALELANMIIESATNQVLLDMKAKLLGNTQ